MKKATNGLFATVLIISSLLASEIQARTTDQIKDTDFHLSLQVVIMLLSAICIYAIVLCIKKSIRTKTSDTHLKNELHKNSKILSIQTNSLKAFTWHLDTRSNMLTFGEEFRRFNIDPSEVNSIEKFAQKIHPDHRTQFLSSLQKFAKQVSGELVLEYRLDLNNTGSYEWRECRATIDIVGNNKSASKHIYAMDLNIDNHKSSQLAMLETQKKLDTLNKQNELILNNTNSGLVFLDNNYIVQWENLSTFLPDLPMTKNYKKGLLCHKAIKNLDEPCPNCVVLKSRNSGQVETQKISHNGMVGELTAIPIFNDDHEFIGNVLKVHNITEMERAHSELESTKNRAEAAYSLLKNIINCVPCLLFIKDIKDINDDYRYMMVNNYFCDVVGLSADDIIGKTDYDIFPTQQEADRCRNDDTIATNSDKLYIFEEQTTFNHKSIVWQTTKATVESIDGRKLLVGVALDITDKIKALDALQEAKEKAEQSNRLKSAFLANMSHEIRTPLNAIVGFSELMADATQQQEKSEYLDIINTNNELLLSLISDILDLSKIEAGMIELKAVEFDVADLFKQLSAMFNNRLVKSEVQFVCQSPYKRCMVKLDQHRFTQVITNFANNAIKFTSKGQITLGYQYVDGGLRTFVSDTGIGIEKSKIERVFERFEKLDNFAQGTGLGMAISKAIIEAHQGKIGLESKQGEGSTFWAWIPVQAEIEPMDDSL